LARRSLKPQLNQIRTWVRQGRTDAWIAHQLDVSVKDITAFKREHELAPPDGADGGSDFYEEDELDLRAEDDALVAAELEAEQEADEDDDEDAEQDDDEADEEPDEDRGGADGDGEEQPKRRRRGRRGGRGRRRGGQRGPLEGTFDHGEEGYGLWLDPSIQDNPVYAEHWAGHRPVTITVEANRIVITRTGEDSEDE